MGGMTGVSEYIEYVLVFCVMDMVNNSVRRAILSFIDVYYSAYTEYRQINSAYEHQKHHYHWNI